MKPFRQTRAAIATATLTLFNSPVAHAQDAVGDPAGANVLVLAVQWIQGTLLGTVATTIAIIAVASVGLMMLTGRVNWRSGATVILGCFIVFGAPTIAAGLRAAVVGEPSVSGPAFIPSRPAVSIPITPRSSPTPVPYDPYAGASVPRS